MADQNETYTEFVERLSTRIVEGIERLQEFQSKAIERVRETVQGFLPATDLDLPFANLLPTPQAVAQANFALAEQVLRAQKSYALGLIESIAGAAKPEKKRD
jgi:hypothetical protein